MLGARVLGGSEVLLETQVAESTVFYKGFDAHMGPASRAVLPGPDQRGGVGEGFCITVSYCLEVSL